LPFTIVNRTIVTIEVNENKKGVDKHHKYTAKYNVYNVKMTKTDADVKI